MTAPDPRRRFQRMPYAQPVLVQPLEGLGATFALTRDAGLGGFAFFAPEPLGTDRPLRATLSLARDLVVGEGRVAWEERAPDGRYRVGVEFTRMDPVHQSLYRTVLGNA